RDATVKGFYFGGAPGLTLRNGLTLNNGTLRLSPNGSSDPIRLAFDGTQTISGTGHIVFDAGTGGTNNIETSGNGVTTFASGVDLHTENAGLGIDTTFSEIV